MNVETAKETPRRFEIIIEGNPTPKARPRFCRRGNYVGTYKKRGEQAIEDEFRYRAKEQLKKQGLRLPAPKDVAISISFECVFAIPKSYSKKKRAELLGREHTKKPDLDNLLKFYIDGLNGIAYSDDSQIARYGEACKRWGEKPRTRIIIDIL
jgi:Holliday junction resolvase RusA-like endonuclease